MNDARTKRIQEIEGLLAERRKYEQWLAQLELRRESTPQHVFEKVHGDYSARLAEAQQALSSESGAVHALAAQLEESRAKHERQIAERTDERAEAELRASVGEFAGKEWDKLRGKLDGVIAELSRERDAVQREIDTLRGLLSESAPAAGGEPKPDVDDIAFLRSVLGRSTPYSSTPAGA
jgi:chromosome segregation ATPase